MLRRVARILHAAIRAHHVAVSSSLFDLQIYLASLDPDLRFFGLEGAGMGVLVLRHVLERRGELALLRAVGYTKDDAARVVMAEHVFVLAAGLLTGGLAAALAIGPTALQPQNSIPFGLLAFFLIGTAALSAAWIRIAAGLALNSALVPALRQE